MSRGSINKGVPEFEHIQNFSEFLYLLLKPSATSEAAIPEFLGTRTALPRPAQACERRSNVPASIARWYRSVLRSWLRVAHLVRT
jgi:hypothetical protein